MTKLQAIRTFVSVVLEDKITIARNKLDHNWGMALNPELKQPRLYISNALDERDEADKFFRKDFIERCPLAQGFASITLTLLHECGHWATRSVFDIYTYEKQYEKIESMEQYVKNPYEMLATQWAICWLQDSINRKHAKAFEKAYFGY